MMSASAETKFVIREITSGEEMREVERLQKVVWGIPDLDVVPSSHLVAATAAGGVLLGAFQNGTMAGFVYGFAGYENGRPVHHSHMLAIGPEFRSFNLGIKLKLAQREFVLNQGIDEMTWTFDPLQSLNAYINFSKLGVVCDRYHVNFYGEDAPSFLHRNGTDRLWVTWLLNSKRVEERIVGYSPPPIPDGSLLVKIGEELLPETPDSERGLDKEIATIEIPGNISEIEKQDSKLAYVWRLATRNAFQKALKRGYLIEEFFRSEKGERPSGKYLLRRGKKLEDIV